jgi:radical SAM protein with 4Fe4S-binding SPASM domain
MTDRRILVRREWFGGLRVDLPAGRMTILSPEQYRRLVDELLGASPSGEGGPDDGAHAATKIVDVEAMGFPLRHDCLSTPCHVYLELTRRCEKACRHCYADARPASEAQEISLARVIQLIERMAEIGAYSIRLTGGEPTLREDLLDILDTATSVGVLPALNTHGQYGEKILRDLLDHGVRDFRISLDGTEEVNDAIRGPGSYRRVMATLRALSDHNVGAAQPVDVTINVVLMRDNRHCFRPLIEQATSLGCKISFGLLRPAGRADADQMLAPSEVASAVREIEVVRRSLGVAAGQVRTNFDLFCETPLRPGPFPFDNSRCPIATTGLGIRADQRLGACLYSSASDDSTLLGEPTAEWDLLELWHKSSLLNALRRIKRSGCEGCQHYRARCDGGCPLTSYLISGSLDAPDPYCPRGHVSTQEGEPDEPPT